MFNLNNKITVDVSSFSIRDTLTETMEHYHITKTDLSKPIGVTQSYISDILNRKKFMNSEIATGIPAKFLLKMDNQSQLDLLYQ